MSTLSGLGALALEEKFLNHEHESYGWYEKNHPDTIKEIEEHSFLKKIWTKEDFPFWLENEA